MSEIWGMGWIPDQPDIRDYTPEHESIRETFAKLKGAGVGVGRGSSAPGTETLRRSESYAAVREGGAVDLRGYCSPVENQLNLGSCTANAAVGMYEYFERRAYGKFVDCSRLFLYKVTRNLLGWNGDTGAFLRTTMGALTLFGTPPEKYSPYNVADFDKEPSSFCYAFAQNYQALQYFRLDPPGTTPQNFLNNVKKYLAGGYVSIIGFTVYDSIAQAGSTGKIPFPVKTEKVLGGHAIALVGYDDAIRIKNVNQGGGESTGALLIRNSWGSQWGDGGYGWLPYDYLLKGLAVDCWSMIKGEWIDSGQFGLPIA